MKKKRLLKVSKVEGKAGMDVYDEFEKIFSSHFERCEKKSIPLDDCIIVYISALSGHLNPVLGALAVLSGKSRKKVRKSFLESIGV